MILWRSAVNWCLVMAKPKPRLISTKWKNAITTSATNLKMKDSTNYTFMYRINTFHVASFKRVRAVPPPPSHVIPKPSITDKLAYPVGVAVNGSGDIVVCEHGSNCISIFSKEGDKKTSFGSDLLLYPYGVAVTDTGDILVCDFGNNCIRLFSPEGKQLKCVGTRGSGPLQFSAPNYTAIHPQSKKIYIIDYCNNRVQVLNSDLTYYTTFANGDLDHPEGIAVDYSTGDGRDKVYVVDRSDNCVKMYAPEGGKPIRELRKNDREHVMRAPRGVAVDSTGVVYVTEFSNDCVSMFNKDGSYRDSFGSRGEKDINFNSPYGIAISGGKIYIADQGNNQSESFLSSLTFSF